METPMPRLDLLKGTLPLLVLSVLRDDELYGYEIAQRIRERSGELFAPSEGSLYPTLHRLEKGGALTATWRASERGPRRRYYAITPSGERAFAEASREWDVISTGVTRMARAGTDA
jgi:PadR family transcriptional regulator, regulatory protein PadR